MAIRILRVRSKEYTSARPPIPMWNVTGSVAVVTDELQCSNHSELFCFLQRAVIDTGFQYHHYAKWLQIFKHRL